ncbi:hypothetical protein U1E44_03635 [Arenibacter sp. GZD96]|uniref:ribbon-helix-helix domain-containing protein n=1 Tax=Aurantibrevibacter litoralis TaxID=3106030 RepID=UPI002AFE0177|nr:hypothetical protein [Arenibacter sp. GZD-96]MEA1785170.1 hypothetical protein [Arenibacter sp. GZD-96]
MLSTFGDVRVIVDMPYERNRAEPGRGYSLQILILYEEFAIFALFVLLIKKDDFMAKTESLNIALTDEMKKFVSSQSGNGTLYATPSEYVRDLIRHERDRQEAMSLRATIIEGYQDIIHGRTREFSGNLMADLKAHRKSQS